MSIPKKKFVIGITGLKGSGKNTLADALGGSTFMKSIFDGCGQMQFAEPLYKMMNVLLPYLGVEKDDIETTRENKETPINRTMLGDVSRRRILQTLGTDWGRNLIHPDIWLKILQARINKSYCDVIIVTDVRFDNEAALIHENGGFIINVLRPEIMGGDQHASEAGINPAYVNLTVINDSTIGDLGVIAARIWELVIAYAKLGKNQRHRVFPLSIISSSREEWSEAKSDTPPEIETIRKQASKDTFNAITASGVVVGMDRLAQIYEVLEAKGLR